MPGRMDDLTRSFQDGPSLADRLPYGEELDGVYLNVDGSLGKVWELGSYDAELASREQHVIFSNALAAFVARIPNAFHAQIILCCNNDIAPALERYKLATPPDASLLANSVLNNKVSDILTRAGLGRESGAGSLRVRRIRLFLCVRSFPDWKDLPGQARAKAFFKDTRAVIRDLSSQWKKYRDVFLKQTEQIENGVKSLNISCSALNSRELSALLYRMFNPRRAQSIPAPLPVNGLIRESVLYSPARIVGAGLAFEGYATRVVTLKDLPGETFPGMFVLSSGSGQAFWDEMEDMTLVFNFILPDQTRAMEQLKAQKTFALIRRSSSFGDLSEEAVSKKEELSGVISRLYKGGQSIVTVRAHVICAGVSEEAAARYADKMVNILGRVAAQAIKEEVIGASLFLTCLPLNYDHAHESFIRRSRRVLSDNFADMLPFYGAFQGTATPAALYLNRRGETVFCDLFDSDTNPHAVIIGASGAGKSFFTNDFIYQNYRLGAHFFVLDKGHSYRKTCAVLSGDYLSFDMENPVRLNPFARVPQAEGLAFLVDMLALMACGGGERDRLSREEKGVLQMAVVEAYARHKDNSQNELVLSDVVAILENPLPAMCRGVSADMAARLALRLMPYTRHGQYGAFFDGSSTFVPRGRFTVFELAQISRYPDLQLVVLLNIMYLITNFVSADDLRGQRKFLIIDEAWQLLKTSGSADFISGAFKTFRKYRCAAVAVTQEASDLLQQSAGLAILANSANKIFLRQESGIIDRLCRELSFSKETGEALRSLVTVRGRYSEALVLLGTGGGVIRLAPDPFLYWAATSDARENEFLETVRQKEGGDLLQALLFCAREMPNGLR